MNLFKFGAELNCILIPFDTTFHLPQKLLQYFGRDLEKKRDDPFKQRGKKQNKEGIEKKLLPKQFFCRLKE